MTTSGRNRISAASSIFGAETAPEIVRIITGPHGGQVMQVAQSLAGYSLGGADLRHELLQLRELRVPLEHEQRAFVVEEPRDLAADPSRVDIRRVLVTRSAESPVDEIVDANGNVLDRIIEQVGVLEVTRVLSQSAICTLVEGDAAEGDTIEGTGG